LKYTDPSGYIFGIGKFVKKHWRVIVAAVVTYVTYGYASEWAAGWAYAGTAANTVGNAVAAGAMAGAAGGATAGYLQTGSLRGTLRGAFSGAIAGAAGGYASFGSVGGWADAARRVGISALGGCGAGKASGGSCSKGAKLAVLAQAVSVSMEMYSNHKPTWKSADGEAVVKAKSDIGVHDSSVTNVGQSIEVDTVAYPDAESLVGRKLSSLNQSDIALLNNSGVSQSLVSWNNGAASFGLGTEYHLGALGNYVPGMNSMAVFHDYWMASQNLQNFGYLAGTIGVTLPINYIGLGTNYYNYLYRNMDD